jgi:hypothetical protein
MKEVKPAAMENSMSIRIDVEPDGIIEIVHYQAGIRVAESRYKDLQDAIVVIKMFIRQDLAIAQNELFIPQLIREANKEFERLLIERENHGKER